MILFKPFAFALAFIPLSALADGIVMKPHEDGWRPAMENSQQALITYRDGIERLTVAIEVDDADAKSMVWLLPVPAAAKQVHIDVLARFPGVRGTEVYGGALGHFGNMRTAAVYMQIWPPLANGILNALFSGSDQRPMVASKAAEAPKGEAVQIHERVEKQGMVSEVITAKEGSALYAYLAGKGLNLKAGSVPTLDFYIGKEYTFVASWFDPGAARPKDSNSNLSRAIEIRFPTKEMYFPLFPTSAYGERVVPATIRVAGHVSPRPFADIANGTSIGYYVANIRAEEDPGLRGTDLYTRIDIDTPAKAFTQDLWISPDPPRQSGLGMATFIVRHPVIVYLALLVALSGLTSLVVGWPIFRELRTGRGALRLLLVGLGNCVSLLGMLATISALPKGWKRRTGYLAAFSLLFMLGAAVVTWQAEAALEPMKPKPLSIRPPSLGGAPRNPDSTTVIVVPRSAAPAPVNAMEIEALYQQAQAMEGGGKAQDAVRIYRRAARAGSGKAAKRLGEIFEKGVPGVGRDYGEAMQWYQTARDLGEKVEQKP